MEKTCVKAAKNIYKYPLSLSKNIYYMVNLYRS